MQNISCTIISVEDVSYVKKRLLDDKNIIELHSHKITNVEIEWGWPKGRKKNKLENDKICAEREVEEETGLKLSKDIVKFISKKTLRESFIGFNGLSYIGNFYMALVNKEYDIKPNDTYEIGDCSWIKYDILKKSMSKARVKLLDSAYQILSNERSKGINISYNIDIGEQTYIDVASNGLSKYTDMVYNNPTLNTHHEIKNTIAHTNEWNCNGWHTNLIKKSTNNGGVFNSTYNTQTLEYGVVSI